MLGTKTCVNRNPFGVLWCGYRWSLNRRPLTTKALTSMAGFIAGDLVAQLSSGAKLRLAGPGKYDMARTIRMGIFGGLIAGPMAHTWFQVLDRAVIPEAPKHPATVILKSALDQLLMAPFGTVVFYASLKSMESQPHMTVPTVREKLIPTLKENYKFWPLAHIINFALVPPSLRILYVNCISVVWAVLLSRMAAAR